MVRWVVGSILHRMDPLSYFSFQPGARCSSVVRGFAHCAMGLQIDPSWGGGGGGCVDPLSYFSFQPGARCSSVVRAFAHGAMGRRIEPSWGGPIELFLVPAIAPRLV